MKAHPLALAALLSAAPLIHAAGQQPADSAGTRTPADVFPAPGVAAGGEREEYLRTLQLVGALPLHQWSIRSHGPRELARFRIADTAAIPRMRPGEWCLEACGVVRRGWAELGVLPARASTWYNSSYPFGINDGVVWAGRGFTAAATAGAHARVGPLSVVLAPIVTWAQNQAFPLEPNGYTDELRFGDEFFPTGIDQPQRFGDRAYKRIDPGESTVRLDLLGATAGISSASQWWGPMTAYPYVLGNNAGGFPHFFAGTATPANIGIGRVHVRVIYGDLAQSEFSHVTGEGARRFAGGLTAVFSPRGLANLEVGGGRFYHSIWPKDGIGSDDLRKPFEGLLKRKSSGEIPDDVHNQLASAFARLTLPSSGVEVYGELGREDHNGDMRDFWLEPDHASTYGLGLRRAWRPNQSDVSVFTAELMNFRITHLVRVRNQGPPYIHHITQQGHTYRGQPLGLGIGARSGEAMTFVYRRYGREGTMAYSFTRHGEATGIVEGAPRRVRFIGAAERSLIRGPLEVVGGLALAHRVGRDEDRSPTNLSLTLEGRWWPLGERASRVTPDRPTAPLPVPVRQRSQ